MQVTQLFFAVASAFLFVSGVSAIAKDPWAACNGGNQYVAGDSCKYYLDGDSNGPIISGTCKATNAGLQCQ
ncbi:uncharacterized protein STEHIDRAFT_158404 [Stereum hirsutum FP-91666 SS1]|uniref:uncharacterized protein n=1 Tax=Stereum hirsutum (strain FP-91666) TaxID=721885 RepID=UPI00044497BC|nr:uncharacterized protein STEHIDRAFT_158404 [Stereum hirsutum FP-91666 SS1]EIM84687.1 hypothetical protein STEHIDRAFT_158404 [Stereum hirsutum FP-91666 SS1]